MKVLVALESFMLRVSLVMAAVRVSGRIPVGFGLVIGSCVPSVFGWGLVVIAAAVVVGDPFELVVIAGAVVGWVRVAVGISGGGGMYASGMGAKKGIYGVFRVWVVVQVFAVESA